MVYQIKKQKKNNLNEKKQINSLKIKYLFVLLVCLKRYNITRLFNFSFVM